MSAGTGIRLQAQTLPLSASPQESLKVRADLDGSSLLGFLQKEKDPVGQTVEFGETR